MPLVEMPGMRPVSMGDMAVDVERRDGVVYLRARDPLPAHPLSLVDRLIEGAGRHPDRTLIADRTREGDWRRMSYAEALAAVRSTAQWLLGRDLSAERPLAILSGNSVDHAILALGAMMAGIPYAPVSPAYSLVSRDHAKLRYIFDLITPGMVYVGDWKPFAPALSAVLQPGMTLVTSTATPDQPGECHSFGDLLATIPTSDVDAAHGRVDGDTVAKFLFTSGSTGMPKAVINTQRMLTCNQVMIAEALAFLKDEPPVMVDWLPWNHTAGGNHNFGIALHNGGSLYIDDGNPTPAGIERTVRNLSEIAPTLYFNVPKGYEMLAEHLAANASLRENFFSRVKILQYAGASLAKHVWDALERLSIETTGEKVMIITGYGSTETAPFASTTTWPVNRPGEIGLPARGLTFKLVPNNDKTELRLKGPSVTPGYWRQPDKTAESFDEEGYYRIGDALRFADEADPQKGLLFDGRVSEDFKLDTGTWVNMAAVKAALIAAFAPFVRDAVLTGLDRPHIGALLFLDYDACRRVDHALHEADEAAFASHEGLRAIFQERLDDLARRATGSSTLVARVTVPAAAPSIDASEVTDKGSINQRAVMNARPALVEDLYRDPAPAHVIVAARS